MVTPPLVDPRTATDISRQVQRLLAEYVRSFRQPTDPVNPEQVNPEQLRGVEAGLVNIFARFSELIIQRLNQVPDKNLLAFLDLLGASRLPPQAARVPLTFTLVTGAIVDGVVPAGTQVAAPPIEGETNPVIFETERELVVTAAKLTSLFVRDPQQDTYSILDAVITSGISTGAAIFRGNQPIEHIFYVGQQNLLSFSEITNLTLTLDLVTPLGDTAGDAEEDAREEDARETVEWQAWNGAEWAVLQPTNDRTQGFTQAGQNSIAFNNLTTVPLHAVNSLENRWLRCRLLTPITQNPQPQAGRVRVNSLPQIRSIGMEARINRTGLAITTAFSNTLPVDLSQDFFPLGEKPKFGDTLYLTHREAFLPGATVRLEITLTNPATGGVTPPPIGSVFTNGNPVIQWEFWTGERWSELRTLANFQDSTADFTTSGTVRFTLPTITPVTTINGVEGVWIRVRLVGGNYGTEDRRYVPINNNPEEGYELTPATLAPPSIRSIALSYELTQSAAPDAILSYNDLVYSDNLAESAQPFSPFQPTSVTQPTLYFGLTLPPERSIVPNRPISLFHRLADVQYDELSIPIAPNREQPRLIWDYHNGQHWRSLPVRDETEAFTRSGLLEFLPPADFALHAELGLTPQYWLRVRWDSGNYAIEPRLQRVFSNTTMAAQTVTLRNQILGSSNGNENQTFFTLQTPVLAGQQLEVRELERPSAQEQAKLYQEEGEDAIRMLPGQPQEIWVRWHQVPDFYGSGSHDRHYTLNHLTGEIRFGNSINGLIPPLGTGNIRMSRYQTGGGTVGNRAVNTIVQLNTTVPYVDAVTNLEPAAGGAAAESLDRLRERAPRQIRHRDRAVTLEDYEDLALLASPEVARAKCVPLYNLALDPDTTQVRPGTLSLILIPRADTPKPSPSLELINRVQTYLDRRRLPNAELIVVHPRYVPVDVTVEIALTTPEVATTVESTVLQTLDRFLHPLTGGFDGTGWDFGRQPHKSDFYALLEAIPGIDHIRTLQTPEINAGNYFLVYSGTHQIRLIL